MFIYSVGAQKKVYVQYLGMFAVQKTTNRTATAQL